MQPLQLTSDERVSISKKIQSELESIDNSSTVVTFNNHEDVAVILEFDSTEETLVLSIKFENMTEKVPQGVLGCPKTVSDVQAPDVLALCEELTTILETEFGMSADVSEARYTFYEWETDTGWYLYETEVSS